jgi:hypothetical protein
MAGFAIGAFQVLTNGVLVQWDFWSGQMYENKTYQELGGRYGAILKSVCSYAI